MGSSITSVAVAVIPFVAASPLTMCDAALETLGYSPTGPVTSTVTVQVPPAAMLPLENDTDPTPMVGAQVGTPHPLVAALVGFATTRAPGKVSENDTPPIASSGFGLVRVNVRIEASPGVTPSSSRLGSKSLSMSGDARTSSAACATPVTRLVL